MPSASSSSTLPPPIRTGRKGEDDDSGDADDFADHPPSSKSPAKPPLSVVDSEELKRKSHGLSLLSPESDDRRLPEGARYCCTRPGSCILATVRLTDIRSLISTQACKIATRARRQSLAAV